MPQADVSARGRGKKLRIAVAVRDAPDEFDGGIGPWVIPGLGEFSDNPRDRVGEEHWELLSVFSACNRGMAGMVYPDGGAVLDQPLLLLDAFAVIGDARARARDGKNA